METINDYRLYLLIRNDLQSMNPGKAVAHGAHAANQFAFEMNQVKEWMFSAFLDWQGQARGFGTTITLHASLDEIANAVANAQAIGLPADLTRDPSYPYIVTAEIANLLKHPDEFPPIYKSPHEVICFREEITAAYVFGAKEDCQRVIGNLGLMP